MSPELIGPIVSGALAIVAAAVGGTLAFFAGRSRAEHEIRYGQLYQRKADVIAYLHGLLYDVEESVTRLTDLVEFGGEPTKKERLQEAGQRLNELRSYYHRNSVWLDDDLSQKIDAVLEELWKVIHEFSYIWRALALSGYEGDRRSAREEGWEEAYKETFEAESTTRGWLELDRRVKDQVPKLRRELRAAFREILGATQQGTSPRFHLSPSAPPAGRLAMRHDPNE